MSILTFGFLKYVAKRLALSAATLFTLATMTFICMRAVPGDPLIRAKRIPAATRANLEAKYGLNKPLLTQYVLQMHQMFIGGDFGDSFRTVDRRVNRIIAEQFPASAEVGTFAIIVGLSTGLILGSAAALLRNSVIDRLTMVVCVAGVVIPSTLLAYMIQFGVTVWLRKHLQADADHWFRIVGWGQVRDVVLPGLTLSLGIVANVARYMRGQMVDVSTAEYLWTARSKGAPTARVVLRHQVRNAILPLVTMLTPIFIATVSGSIFVENVFGIPGLGSAYVNAIANNDYNVLMGLTVFYGGLFVLMSLVTDVLYCLVDPRIRFV